MATIVYHQMKPGTDCPDGICAAWITWQAVGGQLVPDCYRQDDFKQWEEPVPNYFADLILNIKKVLPFDPSATSNVVIVDFSYPNRVTSLLAAMTKLTVLDHHKTRGEFLLTLSLEGRIKGGFDENECGASFAWKYFAWKLTRPSWITPRCWQGFSEWALRFTGRGFIDAPPWFLKHVRRRDIGADGYYEGLTPDSEAIGLVMSNRRFKKVGKAAFPVFWELLAADPEAIIAEGLPEIEERDRAIDRAFQAWVKNQEFVHIAGQTVPLIKCDRETQRHYSMLGSLMARKLPHHPFVAIIVDEKNASHKVELRSRKGGADVSEIAKLFGGGGLYNASGFALPEGTKAWEYLQARF